MKILLVEDDRVIATSISRGLTAEGFTVETSFDGDEGLWRATEFAYDLVVLDLMLPKRNGYQVCAALRAADNWVPILVLTAKDGEYDESEALDSGADDFLTKPFSFVVLLSRVRALLRRGSRRAVAPVRIGSLRIDPAQRRVWRNECEVAVTAREFSVLEYFVRRSGEVVSKTEILSGVWSSDFEGDHNIVEVYVRRLRKKLDEPFGCASIETVRGTGYRLTSDA